MATNLERRIEALERGTSSGPSIKIIAIQLVSPGDLEPENSYCKIDSTTYTRRDDETPVEFDDRMRSIAEGINRERGRPTFIICSATDLAL